MQKIFYRASILFLLVSFLGCNKEAPNRASSDNVAPEPAFKEVVLPSPPKEEVARPLLPEPIEISPLIVPPTPYGIRLSGGGGGSGPADKCGSGVRSEHEECDDGNKISFDGCSASCQLETLLSIGRDRDQLFVIDPLTGATLCQRTVSLAGFTIRGGNGLATDPLTGVLWGLLRESGSPGVRHLVTINPLTGVATNIGIPAPTGLAGIAFDSSATLYGVSGDGGTPQETLFTLNTTNAAATFFMSLGNGSDGEAIAFNNKDKYLYHASGRFSGSFILEKINLSALSIVNVDDETNSEEISGFTYWADKHVLLAGNIDSELYRISSSGVQELVGPMSHLSKGLAFVSADFACP
jgi:cysteine-rich repeat protein